MQSRPEQRSDASSKGRLPVFSLLVFVAAVVVSGFFLWNGAWAAPGFFGEEPSRDELRESALFGFLGFLSLAIGFLGFWLPSRKRRWLLVAAGCLALGVASAISALTKIGD